MYESRDFIAELCSDLNFSIIILEKSIRKLVEENTNKFLINEYKEKLECLRKDYEVVRDKAISLGLTFYNSSESEWS